MVLISHSGGDLRVYAFPKGISLKVNIIAQQEFELAYYDIAVQYVSHYTTETPHPLSTSFAL